MVLSGWGEVSKLAKQDPAKKETIVLVGTGETTVEELPLAAAIK
jgi:hypothetical protein